jgi:hypothetical protein
MGKRYNKRIFLTVFSVVLFMSVSVLLYAFGAGFTGRTKKTSLSGCSCHDVSATSDVIVTISGPDTVTVNQTMQFSLTVSKGSKTGAGLDIAAKNGTLSPVSSNIHLSNGELTNSVNIPFVSGSATVQFNYTAPSTAGTDTLFATGLATNSDGTTSSDDWNWAPNKRIIVKSSIGIQPISNVVPSSYNLNQNYPNPFNPSTSIKFDIPQISSVKLKVMDITGRVLEVLVNENLKAGTYEISWNASKYSSGVYFYSFESKDFNVTKKMLLVK